jgi:hypothetical protein
VSKIKASAYSNTFALHCLKAALIEGVVIFKDRSFIASRSFAIFGEDITALANQEKTLNGQPD